MLLRPAPLLATAHALRTDQLDLLAYIQAVCDHIDATEPVIQAVLPEPDRRGRLMHDATVLRERFPDAARRPPLYGILLGVKDVLRVDGFPTRAGSQLPPELFDGPEASCVTRLREAGALILGKTVSAEFAAFEPGPTRNPHNPDHTPGGSSSGSAAAVAAGFCPLALGTQTIGSVIRPAAFCGIVGFKPTYGRIPIDGMIARIEPVDTIGFFTQDLSSVAPVASLLCADWRIAEATRLPILGVPEGPYLRQASEEMLALFEAQLARLEKANYTIRRVPAMDDIEAINRRHRRLVFAETARAHEHWFAKYKALYRPRTIQWILEGQEVSGEELEAARAGRTALRETLETLMDLHEVDLWLSPAMVGSAPEGISATGDPAMNLPWTHAGMPALTFPMGQAANGLPLGLQITGAYMADEQLVAWSEGIAEIVAAN